MRDRALTKEEFLDELRINLWVTCEAVIEEDDWYYGSGGEKDVLGDVTTKIAVTGSVEDAGESMFCYSAGDRGELLSDEVAASIEEKLYRAYLDHYTRRVAEEENEARAWGAMGRIDESTNS